MIAMPCIQQALALLAGYNVTWEPVAYVNCPGTETQVCMMPPVCELPTFCFAVHKWLASRVTG
jgi:hypothetical protein